MKFFLLLVSAIALAAHSGDCLRYSSYADWEKDVTQRVTAGITDSAEYLFSAILQTKNSGNLVCSALSANMVLAMAAFGAKSSTHELMKYALELNMKDEYSLIGFSSLLKNLNTNKYVTLKIANKMYISNSIAIHPEYKQLTERYFNSKTENINFANTRAAVNTINAWGSSATNGVIREVVTPSVINSDTRVILLNAIYLNATWDEQFDRDNTKNAVFYVDGKTPKIVPTMHNKINEIPCGKIPELDARFVELPYQAGEMNMLIIVPNQRNGLPYLERQLASEKLSTLLKRNSGNYECNTVVHLPKFRVESTVDLTSSYSLMGLDSVFSPSADFSGISDLPLQLSKVLQKVYINVDEDGTEAGAVSVGGFENRISGGTPEVFNIDRPFLALWRKGETTLFSARITDPTKSN